MQKTGVCLECPLRNCECIGLPDQATPSVLFLGGYPVKADIEVEPFSGRNSVVLRTTFSEVKKTYFLPKDRYPAYGYSTLCAPPWDEKEKKYLINADIHKRCSVHIREYIDTYKPRVIVCLGVDALHALGFKGTESDHRGSILQFKTSDDEYIPVICTFHVVKVAKDAGLYFTFKRDIQKACDILRDSGIKDTNMEIETPVEFEDIMALFSKAKKEILAKYNADKKGPVALSVDTETSSLKPYNPDDRMIAVSLSWKENYGAAFPWEHNAHRYTEEQLQKMHEGLSEILSSDKVSIVMANGKFDIQWLRNHYGIKMGKMSYDTMLAEHLLDEDKKGEYSLKSIVKDRFPSMGRYELELQEHLQKCWNKKDEEIARITKDFKDAEFNRIVEWWCGIDKSEREAIFADWLSRDLADLTDCKALVDIETRKLHGRLVPKKSYQVALVRTLRRLPASELSRLGLVTELEIPEHLKVRSFEDADLDVLLKYAAIDALGTRMVLYAQLKNFKEDSEMIKRAGLTMKKKPETRTLAYTLNRIVLPMSSVLADMEYHGVRIDRDRAKEYRRIILEKMDESREGMIQTVGRKFNMSSSSPDLANILFGEFGLPILKRTESGAPSTDADTLRQLSENYDVPFLSQLLVYRKLDKCVHTYIDNWLKMSALDGRIHCTFLQHGTATGRLSSSNPNLQNVPYQLKEAGLNLKALFLPDSDDYDFYDLDISNAEMRTLCAYSKDEALTDAFNTGKDLHCLTGAGISDYTYEDLMANKENKETDQYRKRQLGKKVNFGTVYCIGAEGLSNQLWAEMRIRETPEKCQEYLDKFFETYPGVANYVNETKRFAAMFRYVYTFTGRRRRFPGGGNMARIERQAVNARIQATSSDLVAFNMIDMDAWLRTLGGRLILTVHDSMPFQLPKGMAESGIFEDIKRIITGNTAIRAPWLPVEWKFDVGWGPNYGDTHGEVK